jgi:hypothetical protein
VPALPEGRASELVALAAEIIAADPRRSMVLLATAEARFGRVAEAVCEGIPAVRERAVLEATANLQAQGVDVSSPWEFSPLVLPAGPASVGRSLCQHRALIGNPETPSAVRGHLAELEDLALLELGDWESGRRLFQSLGPTVPRNLPAALHASLIFARGLVAHRFGGDAGGRLAVMTGLWGLGDDAVRPRPSATFCALAAEYAILTEAYDEAGQLTWPAPAVFIDSQPRAAISRYVLARLVLLCESGETDAAARMVADLTATAGLSERCGFSPFQWDAVRNVVDSMTNPGAPLAQTPDRFLRERPLYLRLVLQAILSRSGGDIRRETDACGAFAKHFAGYGPVAAKTRLETLLLQTRHDLADGDAARALNRIEQALFFYSPDATAYYPRLILLRAGLQLRLGRPLAARDTVGLLAAATAASPAERSLAAGAEDDAFWGAPVRPDGTPVAFWHAWLNHAYWTSKEQPDRAVREAHVMLSCAPNVPCRLLSQTLIPNAR